MRTLFDRPLWRDPILFVWGVFLAVVGVGALSGNTTWQGHLEAWRIAGFLRDFLSGALLSFLVLGLLPALIRRWWRSRRDRLADPGPRATMPIDWRSAWGRGGAGGLGSRRQDRGGADLDADWARAGRVGRGGDWGHRGAGSLNAPAGLRQPLRARLDSAPPRFVSLHVTPTAGGPEGAAQVSWRALNADSVTVAGVGDHPTAGSAVVGEEDAQAGFVVTAHGPGGTDSRVVALGVPALSLAQLTSVTMPPGPGITLSSTVRLGSHDDSPLVSTLEGVLRGHDVAESLRSRPAPFPGMTFLREHPLRRGRWGHPGAPPRPSTSDSPQLLQEDR